jgi:hypothetical protein
MPALGIIGQKIVDVYGQQFVFTKVSHNGGSNTVSVDQSANTVVVVPLDGQTAPTVTLGSSDSSTFQKDVTVSGGGSGACHVITWHKTAVGSSKS